MPINRAVFDVELDDSRFQRFKALFDQYQTSLQALPGDWKKIAVQVEALQSAHKSLNASLQAQNLGQASVRASSLAAVQGASQATGMWDRIAGASAKIGSNLASGAASLAKLGLKGAAGLGGLGVIGVGATLFGLDRAAASVSAARRTSLGLGVPYGQYQAAEVNQQRFMANPGTAMQNVRAGILDVRSEQYQEMLRAGVPASLLASGNTIEIMNDYERRLREKFKGVSPELRGTYAEIYSQANFGPEELNALLGMSGGEFKEMQGNQATQWTLMHMSEDAQLKWQNFLTTIQIATKTVQTKFMSAISVFGDDLAKLSEELTNLIAGFISSHTEQIKGWLKSLGTKLDDFGTWLKKPETKGTIEGWLKWLADSARSLMAFVSSFGPISSAQAATEVGSPADIGGSGFPGEGPGGGYGPEGGRTGGGGGVGSSGLGPGHGGRGGGADTGISYSATSMREAGFTQEEYDAFRAGIRDIEGGNYGTMGGAGGRYAGAYQMGPAEIAQSAAELGISSAGFLSNPALQERIFERYTLDHYRQLMRDPAFAALPNKEKLAVLATGQLGVTAAERFLHGGDTPDAWGTRTSSWANAVRRRLRQMVVASAATVHPDTIAPLPAIAPSHKWDAAPQWLKETRDVGIQAHFNALEREHPNFLSSYGKPTHQSRQERPQRSARRRHIMEHVSEWPSTTFAPTIIVRQNSSYDPVLANALVSTPTVAQPATAQS